MMPVGDAKAKTEFAKKPYGTPLPEEVYVAQRAQTNQIEQLPTFLVGSVLFSLTVNGHVGAALSLGWAVLRRFYASAYRNSVGQPGSQSKAVHWYSKRSMLIANSMLMGVVVQCGRYMAVSTDE